MPWFTCSCPQHQMQRRRLWCDRFSGGCTSDCDLRWRHRSYLEDVQTRFMLISHAFSYRLWTALRNCNQINVPAISLKVLVVFTGEFKSHLNHQVIGPVGSVDWKVLGILSSQNWTCPLKKWLFISFRTLIYKSTFSKNYAQSAS